MSLSSSPLAPGDQAHDRDFVVRDLDDERSLHHQRFQRAGDRLERNRPPVASVRPSIGKRILRTLARFVAAVLIGVGLTLAWQSYGEQAKAMARIWVPSLAWALPQSVAKSPPADADILPELAQQLKLIALDVAIVRRNVGQLAANQDQLARKQEQLGETMATLQATEQDVVQKISSPPPPTPRAVRVSPPKTPQQEAR